MGSMGQLGLCLTAWLIGSKLCCFGHYEHNKGGEDENINV